jgi:hypothetical protein
MNRQIFSMWIGLSIVATHIAITIYFIFIFDAPDTVSIQEISLPLTVAYVSSIVLWFFQHDGLKNSDARIGLPLVVLIILIVGSMLGSLFAVPLSFKNNLAITVEQLNSSYLAIETAFGGIFGIVMSQLFGYKKE